MSGEQIKWYRALNVARMEFEEGSLDLGTFISYLNTAAESLGSEESGDVLQLINRGLGEDGYIH